MTRRELALAGLASVALAAQQPKTFHIKLSTPVNSKTSKVGDAVRAALISPESYLNGYVEGVVARAETSPVGLLLLRFERLVYKGNTTRVNTEVFEFVNSKGHKAVDDEERPVTIEQGVLRTTGPELWLDEGSELRLRNNPI